MRKRLIAIVLVGLLSHILIFQRSSQECNWSETSLRLPRIEN